MNIKQNKAITLVSLVITIVIMLILAAVTINLVIGDNGLFNKAKMGTEAYKKQTIKEEIQNALTEIQIDHVDDEDNGLSNEVIVSELPGLLDNLSIESDLTGIYKDYNYHITEGKEVVIDNLNEGLTVAIEKTGALGEENWYKGNVTCNLSATYKKGTVDKIYYSLDNGSNYVEGATFTVITEGINKVQYKAKATDGTESKVYTNDVKIDNTAPEIVAVQDTSDKTKINVKVTDANGTEVTNPDGTLNKLKEYVYNVSDNDTYIFNVKDLAGNTNQTTVEVNNFIPKFENLYFSGCLSCNTFLLTENNTMYIYGLNTNGQLGDGTTNTSSVPRPFKLPNDENGNTVKPKKVYSCNNKFLVIGDDNELYYAGNNKFGQAGNGKCEDSYVGFTKIYLDSNNHNVKAVDMAMAEYNTCVAIGTDNKLYGWGSNSGSMIGQSESKSYSTPSLININCKTPKKVVETSKSTNILCTDGTLYALGWCGYGLLGNGKCDSSSYNTVQVMNPLPNNVKPVDIYAGVFNMFALGDDNNLYGIGLSVVNMLGNPNIVADGNYGGDAVVYNFRKIELPTEVAKVSCSVNYTIVLGKDNKVYSWGDNYYKEQANETEASMPIHEINLPDNVVPIDVCAGNYCSLIKTSDGKFYSWGYNGCKGLGRTTEQNSDFNIVKTDFSD